MTKNLRTPTSNNEKVNCLVCHIETAALSYGKQQIHNLQIPIRSSIDEAVELVRTLDLNDFKNI